MSRPDRDRDADASSEFRVGECKYKRVTQKSMNTSVNAYVRQTEMPHIEAGSTNMNPRNICVTLPCTLSGAPEPSYKRANSGSRMDVNTNISIGFCHTGRV